MTTLILARLNFVGQNLGGLAQKKLFSIGLSPFLNVLRVKADFMVGMDRLTARFLIWNRDGLLTASALIFIAVAVLGYLVSAYVVFEIGFKIQGQESAISQLESSVASKEINLHELRTGLANDGGELLNSMEKVSALRYIGEEGKVTASLPATHP